MGDCKTMKTYILIAVLSTMILHAAVPVITSPSVTVVTTQPEGDKELTWVDEQIRAIIPTRVGVPDGFVNSLRDPMKMNQALSTPTSGSKLLAPPKLGSDLPKVIEEPLRLTAIMNQSVFINGKWYKVGDNIRTFSLAEIKSSSVLLAGKKDQKLILFLSKQNSNIKIITK
jgi:hypothetical protein